MRRLFPILLGLIFGSQSAFAQVSKLESFREKVLPEYSIYFSRAELTENGQLSLSATVTYTGISVEARKTVMVPIASAWKDSIILVNYGSKRELWGWNARTGSTKLLDQFDINATAIVSLPGTDPRPHPWFFYIGFQLGGDNQSNINIALNTRLGFYLLKNRWDFATTLSGGVTGNTAYDASGTGWANVGLMSRVHFPIRKINLSPSVGGQVTVAVFGQVPTTVNYSLVLGVSWYIGFGSVDIGINIGNIISGAGGVTISPRPGNGK